MNETILILGGDGYLGWPLAMKLALDHPDQKIIVVDNLWRRNTVDRLGFAPLLQMPKLADRIAAFHRNYGLFNMQYRLIDVCSNALDGLIREERPAVIYHLAQQCSATYSMSGIEEALHTLRNNEEGNMRLLWAVRNYVPEAHIIKLGSFGEYAKGGLPVAEGYFQPIYKGQAASSMMPYPRAADDIYHVSKINDSNYVAMASRTWGLRITEVMQATIFGLLTDEMDGCQDLFTRFDYDPIFGTVANRFVAQSVCDHPLTIYGGGHQRTGLMALRDAVCSLARFASDIPRKGEHRVINHVTETHYSINELAHDIAELANREGLHPEISYIADLRGENFAEKPVFEIETALNGNSLYHSDFSLVVQETIALLLKQRKHLLKHHFLPHVSWSLTGLQPDVESEVFPFETTYDNESYWENFRKKSFASDRINLNLGCLGTVYQGEEKQEQEIVAQINGDPLAFYTLGREAFVTIKNDCTAIWPSEGYRLAITYSTSQTMNLLALALLRKLQETQKGPFKVVTSKHEHPGGVSPFEQLPEYQVLYMSDCLLEDSEALHDYLQSTHPAIVLLSHVYYHTGKIAQNQERLTAIKRAVPNAILILDVAQSIGIMEIPFGSADVLLGSAHKWLLGPQGVGLAWFKDSFARWIGALFWNKQHLFDDPKTHGFSIPGGQDFLLYERLKQCLQRYRKIGPETVLQRSHYLADFFKSELQKNLEHMDLYYRFADDESTPVISLMLSEYDPYPLYHFLNRKGIHIKCIKNCLLEEDKLVHILRFGIPYYETMDRLRTVLETIRLFMRSDAEIMQPSQLAI